MKFFTNYFFFMKFIEKRNYIQIILEIEKLFLYRNWTKKEIYWYFFPIFNIFNIDHKQSSLSYQCLLSKWMDSLYVKIDSIFIKDFTDWIMLRISFYYFNHFNNVTLNIQCLYDHPILFEIYELSLYVIELHCKYYFPRIHCDLNCCLNSFF